MTAHFPAICEDGGDPVETREGTGILHLGGQLSSETWKPHEIGTPRERLMPTDRSGPQTPCLTTVPSSTTGYGLLAYLFTRN
jgi:hypothetical protein